MQFGSSLAVRTQRAEWGGGGGVSAGMCMRAYCHVMWSALEIAACHKGGMDPCALSGMAEIQLSKVNLSSRNNPCYINVPQTAQQRKGRERVSDVPGKRAGELIVWERERWERFLGMTVDSGLESFSTSDQGTRCRSGNALQIREHAASLLHVCLRYSSASMCAAVNV